MKPSLSDCCRSHGWPAGSAPTTLGPGSRAARPPPATAPNEPSRSRVYEGWVTWLEPFEPRTPGASSGAGERRGGLDRPERRVRGVGVDLLRAGQRVGDLDHDIYVGE